MNKVYHLYLCDDDMGEVEGMFNESGELLGGWCLNDANWRSEYMDGFMAKLGFDVVEPPKKMVKAMTAKLRDHFGF